MIRKQCLRGATVEESIHLKSILVFTNVRKLLLFTLVRITKRLTTRQRPLQVN